MIRGSRRRRLKALLVTLPEQILIDVPAPVSEDLFGAVQEQLEENRKRKRARARGAT